MKNIWETLKRYSMWLLALLCVDVFAALLLWLSDLQAFKTLLGLILLWSLILFAAVLGAASVKERKKQKLFDDFLSCPDAVNEEKLFCTVSGQEREQLKKLTAVLRENQMSLNELNEDLKDYEEYVEGWAHEAKTPLSLLTLILDNRADEIPNSLQNKLDYVRSCFQEDISQMLYYARLKSSTKDYRFEMLDLRNSIQEVLEDYAQLLEEKHFTVQNDLKAERVFTDRRGIQFMLGQIISNAVKYSGSDPKIIISMERTAGENILSIADNGIGVKSYDLPYIFQKGFTGDATDSRKKATGMGLYLTKKMADDLNLKLDVKSEWGRGLTIYISFPKVNMP